MAFFAKFSVFSSLLPAAHFYRAGDSGLTLLTLAAPLMLLARKRWMYFALQLFYALGAIVWAHTAAAIAQRRIASGEPWGRAALIIGLVSIFAAACALILRRRSFAARYQENGAAMPSVAAFAAVFTVASFARFHVDDPTLLLADRFADGLGWLQIAAGAFYAGFMTERLTLAPNTAHMRSGYGFYSR